MNFKPASRITSPLVLTGAVSAAAAGAVLYGIHGRASQVFGRSVYRGPGRRRSIALSFDDGPNPATLPLLDYLEAEGIRATFFQCGRNVRRSPEIARAVLAAGHEIGNHTFNHPRLCPRLGWPLNLHSPAFIYEELRSTQEMLLSETGQRPTLFRAPYGMRWFGVGGAQQRLGLTGVMWTVIGHDWEWPAGRIGDLVLSHAAPGGIVCLHDGRDIQRDPDLTEMRIALRRIVTTLKSQGYTFETVSDLMRPDAQVPADPNLSPASS